MLDPRAASALGQLLGVMKSELDGITSICLCCGGEKPVCIELEFSKLSVFGEHVFGLLPLHMVVSEIQKISSQRLLV